ncbi:hypothetical protein QVD17_31710 [Tagetes erecta]|uniref:Uncharacterized protein n=1 Tax=Tagetes erecta TaxID=13708 RepID=A0AAD8NP29_TARER|nr:hypothetical protein QVD17_31710 [Tagetes erecta]
MTMSRATAATMRTQARRLAQISKLMVTFLKNQTGFVRVQDTLGLEIFLVHWRLAARHPLTTPTNNMNEALGMLEESVYYSPRADPRRRGVLDDLSTRAQPHEPQRRYARPAFVAKTNDGRNYFNNREGTIDSHEAARRYRGSFMP